MYVIHQVLSATGQQSITICYDDTVVGEFVADMVVEDTVILEVKSELSCNPV